ncbi:GTP-binding protein [Kitasatospora sp. NPDC049258]|uniref:sulfate adenylyltransferase subunit 1 n=1 Tax=Kitasatospora sp. NPDC049258 TaxID=3155394 RepID=UPI003448AC30
MTDTLLRVVAAGSVDDGKSTLIGRLLHDSCAVPDDQLAALLAAGHDRGTGLDLSLLTDGLRAEREQGITIDVAYRYFATPRRSFVLIDTPGHVQYTRNMVTGASTADAALLLVDVRAGLTDQTRRHTAVVAALGVRHVLLVVNKMDLAGWAEPAFRAVEREFRALAERLGIAAPVVVPVSAATGDNVVELSAAMPWYAGGPLLARLEDCSAAPADARPARMPVQVVLRAGEYRGYAGRIESGVLRPGDEVVALPSGATGRIAAIDAAGRELAEAGAGRSVVLRLHEDLDISRGELLASAADAPEPTRDLTGTVCWFSPRPLRVGARLLVRHGTQVTRAVVRGIGDRFDPATAGRLPGAAELELNALASVTLRTMTELPVDAYDRIRATGAFLLLDEHDGDTLGAGMAVRPGSAA